MGTRADFYIGTGPEAEWLGSIAWDGHADTVGVEFSGIKDESGFRAVISKKFSGRDDFTKPEVGWPWPWNDSHTTDFAYAFSGEVLVSCFGSEWRALNAEMLSGDFEWPENKGADVPDMSSRKAVTLGPRSGVIVIGG